MRAKENSMNKRLLMTFALVSLMSAGPVAFAADADPVDAAIAATTRTDADRDRDTREKPAEVLKFAGVKPGMTVVDMFSGGGYYAELLAGVVGPSGKVIAVNNVPYGMYAREDLKKRFTEGRLPTVERRLVEASWMDLPAKSADLVVIVMSYHDAFWVDEKEGWPAINVDGFVGSLKRVLKPGGKLLIVDHNAAKGTGTEVVATLHRLNEDYAKQSLTSRGFVLEKSFDGLRNPSDDLGKLVFDPAVKGKTDRYVHLYRVK
jgi:predicted methyltransferase